MRQAICAAVLALCAWSAAEAQPVDGNTARKMLFAPKGFAVAIEEASGLDARQIAYVRALVDDPQFKRVARYYGAMALSPTFFDRVLAGNAGPETLALVKFTDGYNNPEAAAAAAMGACREALGPGDRPCVLAARILPRRWTPQPVSMSVFATAAFRGYRREKGPKAFAVSRGSKAYTMVAGEGARETALTRCNAQAAAAGSPDCEILIVD